jgi:bifunctional non-homologous end joining protein LigD
MDKTKGKVRTAPTFIRPMLCKSVRELPTGHEWVYEVKRGGRRTIAVKDHRRVKLFREDGQRLEIPVESVVIDGEIISLNPGTTTYEADETEELPQLYAWDLLHLNGKDLTSEPVEKRKRRLCTVLLDSGLLFSPSLDCAPQPLLDEVKRLSLEGVMAKRRGSLYEAGRCTGTWVKVQTAGGSR